MRCATSAVTCAAMTTNPYPQRIIRTTVREKVGVSVDFPSNSKAPGVPPDLSERNLEWSARSPHLPLPACPP